MKTTQALAIIPAIFTALALLSCDTNREAEEVAPQDMDTTTAPSTTTPSTTPPTTTTPPPTTTTTPPPQSQEAEREAMKVPEAELNRPQQPE